MTDGIVSPVLPCLNYGEVVGPHRYLKTNISSKCDALLLDIDIHYNIAQTAAALFQNQHLGYVHVHRSQLHRGILQNTGVVIHSVSMRSLTYVDAADIDNYPAQLLEYNHTH